MATSAAAATSNVNTPDSKQRIPKLKSAGQNISMRFWARAYEALTKNENDTERIEELILYLDGTSFD